MRLALLLALLLSSGSLRAQQAPVLTYTGRVVNVAQQPLSGVSVLVKGTAAATVTNADGVFLLAAPAGPHTLEFTYPGHLAVQLPVVRPDSVLTVKMFSTQPRATPRKRRS